MKKSVFGSANVKNVVNSLVAAQRGVCVVAFCSLDNKMADKANKGRAWRLDMWTDRPLVSYSGNVNANSDEKFTPNARKGFEWIQYPIFERAIKSGVEYLTFSYRDSDRGSRTEVYFLDGNVVDKSVIKPLMKPTKTYAPKTQIEVGVVDPNKWAKVIRYELDNVVYVVADKAKAIDAFEGCK
jgi:hypothetical protein